MRYKNFIKLCKMTQSELKTHVTERLQKFGYTPICGDGYVYAKGSDVLLTAHLDTVHKELVRDVVIKDGTITSPQGIGGDDRCGVFIILRVLSETKYRPSILFCEDEESGGVGSGKFADTLFIDDLMDLKFLVEIDRHGNSDAVFYSCDNPEFTDFITKTTGYKEEWGTFSDICNLSPVCGVASVNLSCGYYDEHRPIESVVYKEMIDTKNAVVKLLRAAKDVEKPFEYIEGYKWDLFYPPKYDYGYDYGEPQMWVMWKENGTEKEGYYNGELYEALGRFFFDNPTVTYNDIIDYDVYTI